MGGYRFKIEIQMLAISLAVTQPETKVNNQNNNDFILRIVLFFLFVNDDKIILPSIVFMHILGL